MLFFLKKETLNVIDEAVSIECSLCINHHIRKKERKDLGFLIFVWRYVQVGK